MPASRSKSTAKQSPLEDDVELHFDVSSGLKSVLGNELITDDEVAIFELVKNSFDASATYVDLYFAPGKIVISDNGVGMTMDDVRTKWLFVGYSAKREQNRGNDFRDSISARKHFAGSKGVGRLSSDRLGQFVTLQTRSKKEVTGPVHRIKVDWDLFDRNHLEHFEQIKVEHTEVRTGFEVPQGLHANLHGTVVTIENTRKQWDRDAILKLKSALAKLINPFGADTDGFTIEVTAPDELTGDRKVKAAAEEKGEEPLPSHLVNSEVGNFIFSTLRGKTTFIDVRVTESGDHIESTLTDRGELIYKVREPNDFPGLKGSGFRCELYFLNASAKTTFARRMGVPSVEFGSVFVFRNGFRVFPIGEEGDDWFKMDRRKQQGYARFLGSRDVIGRIEVEGHDSDFGEASSRDKGLIETPAVVQLRECFMECCLKRLEKYVVPVTFPDTEDKYASDVSRLLMDPGRARVAAAVAKLVDDKKVELLDYSRRLIGILNERSEQFESSITNLLAIAEKTQDKVFYKQVQVAKKRFDELREAEEAARLQADEERKAKEKAQARAAKAEASEKFAIEQLEEEKKRNLFLTSISSLDADTILNFHHQVIFYAVDMRQQIENFLVSISGKKAVSVGDVVNAMESIAMLNSKIMGVSRFATKANFRLDSDSIDADLGEYIKQYVESVARDDLTDLELVVDLTGKGFSQRFKPIEVAVVIDNLIRNASKAGASEVHFSITRPHKGSTYIDVWDNGSGFSSKIQNLQRIFEKGFTTTDGSGLGLFHVRQVLGEMNGSIEAQRMDDGGAKFQIRVSK